MLSTSSDMQKDSLLVIQDGNKFHSRLLSKESSAADPSFRVYYGVASGSVPFQWESQPGTPKHVSSGTTLPPLTPPPFYYSTTAGRSSISLKPSRSLKLVHAILPSVNLKKSPHAPSPSSPSSGGSLSPISSASSSSSSSFSSAATARRRSRRSSGLFFSSSKGEDEDSDASSPTSAALCFGRRLKNVLLSIAGGHGSRHGAAAA